MHLNYRFFSFLPTLLLAAILLLMPPAAQAQLFADGGYNCDLREDGTVYLYTFIGEPTRFMSIPSELNNHPVTALGNNVFFGCDTIETIILPDSVTEIAGNPFSACNDLKEIRVSPDHPVFADIDGVLFSKADRALVTYPAGRSEKHYKIPAGIRSIGQAAFGYSKSLESVDIPDSVTEIGDKAFISCGALSSVTIPQSVVQIGVNPFVGCYSLESIDVAPGQTAFSCTGGALMRTADAALIACLGVGLEGVFCVPDGTQIICRSAFDNCHLLKSVTLPDSVTEIGGNAFNNCTRLQSIDLPQGLTQIGDFAFSGCKALTAVSLPSGITQIGRGTFSECAALETIAFPHGLTAIGERAFEWCASLTDVALPEGLTSVGSNAFFACLSLASLTLPESLITIGDDAFGSSAALAAVTIPEGVQEIGWYAFRTGTKLTVKRGSYAAQWAKDNGYDYAYPDENDWLTD